MADEQKPSGVWWLIPIIGGIIWAILRRKKHKPDNGGNGGTTYPTPEYRIRVTSYALWAIDRIGNVERALDQLVAAKLTSAGRAFLCRHGWNLIPWAKGTDGKYHVRRGDVLWNEQHGKNVRAFLEMCKRRGLLIELDAYDWCSMREAIEDDWGGHPLNSKHSNSGIKDQWDFFKPGNFDITKLWLERIRELCRGYESIVEFMAMNEPPETAEARAWERETLKYAKQIGFERRVTSMDDKTYAARLVADGLAYAAQWHNTEDTGDMNRGSGSQVIYDTDGAENKPKLPYGEMARKAIRSGTHFYAMTPETLPDGTYTPSVIAALAGEMAWWHQQNPKH